ncbi:MAG: exo-alpha-sialidase, partial [Cyclobacteriaceae bacterium]|nr:exo-alpha-sialidase [Cyclobacteriaceae bacterium]
MKFHRIALSLFILLARFISTGFAQSGISEDLRIEYTTEVFREGEKNYLFFRIPSLLFSGKIIYAFCEGRKNSLADHGQIDIVLKKSGDFGRTWGDLMIVTAIYNQSCQNPTPIYIQEDDKIILLFTKRTVATDTEDQIRSGTASGYAGAYSAVSLDQGRTWSEILEITDQVKLENWRWYAFGPGGAIHINNAELYKGRIIVPANHSIAGSNGNELLGAHVVYSDDNGKSWHIGATDSEGVGTVNPNELTVAETESGTLYFNARSQNNDPDPVSNRAITYSGDGGITFARKFLHEPQ